MDYHIRYMMEKVMGANQKKSEPQVTSELNDLLKVGILL
jgi:hypothetical protein